MLTVTQLRAFLAVARAGAVQAAAQELHVSQPSVSAALAALARELGVQLVERDGRGIRLTEAGIAFEPYAAEVLGLLDQGRRAAVETDAVRKAQVRVVTVNTAGEYLLPPLIHAYRRIEPRAEVLLEIGNRATVLERLTSHSADVGVGGRPPGSELDGSPFLDNELIVVGPEAGADLGTATWLLREPGSGTRSATEAFLADRNLDPPELLTLGSNGAVKQALAIGLGVTLISRHAVTRELRDGSIVQLEAKGTPLIRPWYVLLPRGVPTRPAVKAFCEFLGSEQAGKIISDSL